MELIHRLVEEEVKKARAKFPRNRKMFAAIQEEAGEVAEAFLELEFGNVTPEVGTANIVKECCQAAGMYIRLATEGSEEDPSYIPPKYLTLKSGESNFEDVKSFHDKFDLKPDENAGHVLKNDVQLFRLKFLFEELLEYAAAIGAKVVIDEDEDPVIWIDERIPFNPEKAFDALLDLEYVTHGTTFLHKFPHQKGWNRVQAANMAKVRASGADDPRSVRKHSADVVKPEGWKPADLSDLVDLHVCGVCDGWGNIDGCVACDGTGRTAETTPKLKIDRLDWKSFNGEVE